MSVTLKYGLQIGAAEKLLKGIVDHTPLQHNANLSRKYDADVWLKREDLQVVRSYKLRGAYNMMSGLSEPVMSKGVVCASAGNHAQGFAYCCNKLKVYGTVFMPTVTPKQKIQQTKMFGGSYIEINLIGDSFDDCVAAAKNFCDVNKMTFIPAFDDVKIIEGQATVGVEICNDLKDIDYIFMPIGGGGLAAGVGAYCKDVSPFTKLIGLEPEGAPSMTEALRRGRPVMLDNIDKFVDGVAVRRVGDITFPICKEVLEEVFLVPEGRACTTILSLYNEDAIVAEPAGVLSIAALGYYSEKIKGKKIVCIVSGGNNDIDRLPEIKERSLLYEGIKRYFLIDFSQRPGAIKEFVNHILGNEDNITRLEYVQKTNKDFAPALVGIELADPSTYPALLQRMKAYRMDFKPVNNDDRLFSFFV